MPNKERPSVAGEFRVIDQLVEQADECATWRHPAHPDLTSAMFARVLLVMYGVANAQGKLAGFFRDNDLDRAERMFFFAVGTCLDSAIDTSDSIGFPASRRSPSRSSTSTKF
jgi:hypothetical protein